MMFPKTVYVKIEGEDEDAYLECSEGAPELLTGAGDEAIAGEYRFVRKVRIKSHVTTEEALGIPATE